MSNPDDPRDIAPTASDHYSNVISFPDRRRGVEDALEAELTSTETAVLLVTGRIQPPKAGHELKFHDPESRIAGSLTTIRALEQSMLSPDSPAKQRIEALRNVAESIIMGELPGDIRTVDDSYQDDVLAMITNILTCLSDERDLIEAIFHTLSDETILDALGLADEELMEILNEEKDDPEGLEVMLAELILKAREKIDMRSTRSSRLRTGIRALKPVRLLD